MKRTFAAASIFAALASSASAADLPVKAIAPPPPPGWAGAYGGISGGFGVGHSDQTDPGAIPLPDAQLLNFDGHYSVRGGLVGGTLGYNWQREGWVYGVEGDMSWANLSGRSDVCGPPAPHPCGTQLDALGTFRGRVGHVAGANGDWLLYATGGLAFGDVRGWDAMGPTFGNDWRAGWTVGAGLEAAFAPRWTAKLEYLYVDLGNAPVFNVSPGVLESVSLNAHLVRAGLNYRFADAAPAPRFPVKAPAPAGGGWAGWYAGFNAGYLDGASRLNTDAVIISNSTTAATAPAMATVATSALSTGNGGFIGGAQAGYNFLLSPTFLAGFEADIQGTSLRGSASTVNSVLVPTVFGPATGTFTGSIATSRSLDYIGTVRARVGATVTPGLLLYVTGGLAYGGVRSNTTIIQTSNVGGMPTLSTTGSFSDNRAGYTVGAGGEWMALGKWSVKAEYLYYDLGSATYGTGGYGFDEGATNLPGFLVAGIATSTRVRFNGNIARIGLNYHLN